MRPKKLRVRNCRLTEAQDQLLIRASLKTQTPISTLMRHSLVDFCAWVERDPQNATAIRNRYAI